MKQNLVFPVRRAKITAGYMATEYFKKYGYNHYGVDMVCVNDKYYDVYACGNGTVIDAGNDGANSVGNVVIIRYNDVVIADMDGNESVKDLINLAQNLDLYRFYPDISNEEELGRLYADELHAIEIPEHIQNYFDYEAYGRDVKIRENGVFAPGGYVAADPGAFIEYYHGPEDIPKEHRVFAYPKEAEPARSILKAIREFQEAPPAPRKDKAGLSHEER